MLPRKPHEFPPGRFLFAWLASALVLLPSALESQEVELRLELADPTPASTTVEGELTTSTILVPEGSELVDVEVQVILVSAVEPCVSDPSACDGSENFINNFCGPDAEYGCADGIDNDSDGLTDGEDPDCIGVVAWSFSLTTDDSFLSCSDDVTLPCSDGVGCCATTEGTVAAPCSDGAPALRDPGGSFEATVVVDPAVNGGVNGVATGVVLSIRRPILLEQIGEEVVLRYRGKLDASGLGPGERTAPCVLAVLPPTDPGLVGLGAAVPTRVTVGSDTALPVISRLALVVEVTDSTPPEIACPADIEMECVDVEGAVVEYSVTAVDAFDPSPSLVCEPPSGTLFPPGTTSVVCTATDSAGNQSSCSFDVRVTCADDRPFFLRGDCDADGQLLGTVTDAIVNFQHCFSGRAVLCRASCDADGDGSPCSGVTDGVLILQFIFRGGLAPPAPFPDCGPSDRPEDAALGCEQSGCAAN